MFNTKNDTSLSQNDTSLIDSQYITTMKKDLEGSTGTIQESVPLENQNKPPLNTIWQQQAPEKTTQPIAGLPNKNILSEIKISNTPPIDNVDNIISQKTESNPFLNKKPETIFPQQPINQGENNLEKFKPQINIPSPDKTLKEIPLNSQKDSSLGKILIIAILALIILALIGGGYYFWASGTVQPEEVPVTIENEPVVPAIVEVIPPEEPVEITPVFEKYSPDKPNLITIDPAIISEIELKKIISDISTEINASALEKKAVEFILVDTNNAPIPFSKFSSLAKISLPKTLTSSINENFSLYFYKENATKTGLQIGIKSKVAVTAEMKNSEKTLPNVFSFLYTETLPQIIPSFNSSTYNANQIRYSNLDPASLLSFDYTVSDKYLSIGTSKESLRAIIDKATTAQ